jgi:hypothetical protein
MTATELRCTHCRKPPHALFGGGAPGTTCPRCYDGIYVPAADLRRDDAWMREHGYTEKDFAR